MGEDQLLYFELLVELIYWQIGGKVPDNDRVIVSGTYQESVIFGYRQVGDFGFVLVQSGEDDALRVDDLDLPVVGSQHVELIQVGDPDLGDIIGRFKLSALVLKVIDVLTIQKETLELVLGQLLVVLTVQKGQNVIILDLSVIPKVRKVLKSELILHFFYKLSYYYY